MSAFAVIRDWAPRDHADKTTEDHHKRMWSVGTYGSKVMYFNPLVTGVSAFLIWGFIVIAMLPPTQEDLGKTMIDWQAWVTDIWNWLYMVSQNVWIVVLLYMMIKYWNLKLGKDDEEKQFSDITWFAMLFSCGVATGLWYYTAEGMWHYEGYGTPRWMDKEMFNYNTRAEHSLMICLFHWGPHGWIPYSLVGAVIGLLSYRRGFPMSMRFTMYPLIGEMCYGPVGDAIEILSICCTLFGVTTSLGLGALQLGQGLVRLDKGTYLGEHAHPEGNTGMEVGKLLTTVIILVITFCATMSVVVGLKRGIAFLAQVAFGLSFFILISVLFMDDTWYILNALTSAIGYYLWYLPKVSFHTDAWEELGTAPDGGGGKKGWMNGWTIFYWGWWISWGPFCGTFLARISRGRTLGSYIMGSLIVPSIWSFAFLGIFGAAQIRITNDAINAGLNGSSPETTFGYLANKAGANLGVIVRKECACPQAGTLLSQAGNLSFQCMCDEFQTRIVSSKTTRLYMLSTENVIFEQLASYGDPDGGGPGFNYLITGVTLACIALYFVTSSDSASFVVDMLAANGIEHPPMPQKVFWCVTEGLAACALLWAAADDPDAKVGQAALNVVKPLPIVLGLPFTFVLFWVSQSALILCREEAGEISVNRKNFSVFLLNFEPRSFMAMIAPFIPFGELAEKSWGGNKLGYTVAFGILWHAMIVFDVLAVVDNVYTYMAACLFFMCGLIVAGLRASVRDKLGISGDFISDCVASVFAFPWVLGQMTAEDFSKTKEVASAQVIGSVGNI